MICAMCHVEAGEREGEGEGGGGGKRWNEKDVDDPLPHGDVMYIHNIHTYIHVE